ncbi:MAG: hypothetical protein CMP76_07165 [Flavobacterium sp.]|uniref:helix-turn-helix domain-containing protein n=1 Tax=Flavobacterium sp. TaxID=239 RepID=UPI000C3DA1AB|nr:helix-turn-helix domain-containing protein [Flavobacterium sp.]MBF03062.1 hypothetical protein [Flavobacterium sp.]
MKKIILFSLLFLFQLSSGQVSEMDLKKMSYDELKKGFLQNSKDLKLQRKFSDLYLLKAKFENNDSLRPKGYYMKSLTSDSYESIKYLDSVILYSKKVNNIKDLKIAYFEKANKLDNTRDFGKAIETYINLENLSKKTNDTNYFYEAKFSIALIKSEDMGEIAEALKLYKECYSFYKRNKEKKKKYYATYLNLTFAIADAHRALTQLDSSSYYNKLGYKESIKNNNERLKGCFILNEGATLCLKKNYNAAIDSINKALPIMVNFDNKMNQIASYYYYGKSYEGLNKKDTATIYYEKIDSIHKQIKYINLEFVDGYRYLINYYKEKGNTEKQLTYLNTLMSIDSIFQVNYKGLSKKLSKEYDIPNLIREKETIINELNSTNKKNNWILIILIIITILCLIFIYKQQKLKKEYKKRFQKLMLEKSDFEKNNKISDINIIRENNNSTISDEISSNISKQLFSFENRKEFLKANITIQSLSKIFNTNSKYLSVVINSEKGKSFSNYINDLRVDFIIEELKNNKALRKFTIAAIAEEAGFNTAESFSKAFFKRTGIKPSYFIKEITNLKETENQIIN